MVARFPQKMGHSGKRLRHCQHLAARSTTTLPEGRGEDAEASKEG
jgi:hypothetical protein